MDRIKKERIYHRDKKPQRKRNENLFPLSSSVVSCLCGKFFPCVFASLRLCVSILFNASYDAVLALGAALALPKLLWNLCVHGKYKKRFAKASLPALKTPLIWIHAVSMGETKAAEPLFNELKKKHPNASFLISSTTETGHEEAKRLMNTADAHIFLPLDFSWKMKKCMKTLRPSLLILIEGDLWYNLLRQAKAIGAQTVLASGKISERSFQRFRLVSFFTKRLFKQLDLICVQNTLYKERFLGLDCPPDKLDVTGNLKLDAALILFSEQEKRALRQDLSIDPEEKVVVVGSTHPGEETLLIEALRTLNTKIILVPRHPERFKEVEALLHEMLIPFSSYSKRSMSTGKEKVILIDAMGKLSSCYQLADAAIVGGSFVKGIGGHNIFEPISLAIPTFFGPYMHKQSELATQAISACAGIQVDSADLAKTLSKVLENPRPLQLAAEAFTASSRGSLEKTLKDIDNNYSSLL